MSLERARLDDIPPMSSSFKLMPADERSNCLLNAIIFPLSEDAVHGESGTATIDTAAVSEALTVATIFTSQAEAERTRVVEYIHSPIDPVQHVYTGEGQ